MQSDQGTATAEAPAKEPGKGRASYYSLRSARATLVGNSKRDGARQYRQEGHTNGMETTVATGAEARDELAREYYSERGAL